MNLPENVVMEILLRLPVRSVLRFRCVCKGWCALIKSSLFKNNHLALKHASDVGDDVIVFQRTLTSGYRKIIYRSFVTCYDYESFSISVPAAPSSNEFEVTSNFSMETTTSLVLERFINHVDGVLCLVGGDEGNRCSVSLLNPTIREIRKVPVPDLGFKWYPEGLGFGFDNVTNEYKVVGIVTVVEEDFNHKHIGLLYRLSTNSWKILCEIPPFLLEKDSKSICNVHHLSPPITGPHLVRWYYRPFSCTFSHGSVHWLMSGVNRILTFNMTTESFQEIQFPPCWEDYDYEIVPELFTVEQTTITLVAFANSLACDVNSGRNRKPSLLDVWVMEEYGITESWTKQYSVNPFPEKIKYVLCFWKKDKILLETRDNDLICYDLSKCEVYQPYSGGVDVMTCIESFVSVKVI